ncbi:efflux RND transporter periplasmic adaptor subunit [Opitutus sp. ER46]|uniref:efflux RND transporter periplasmic adaptor subunit n=1 Tax=Opitutus sp. ER46 TaxID=2161864 RepID=UPI001304A677|nr:efflux RND transporter periplasmic adaptor subunit [Opitutus sp. ER46]
MSVLRVATAALLVAVAGCSKSGSGSGGRGGGGAPVLVGKAERKVVPLVIDAVGTVEPIRAASVRAQITGTLLRIAIREGQDVAEGDLLFEIDPRPFESTLRSALADQKRIQVQFENARAQVERYKRLDVGRMVSQEEAQQVQDAARALEAQAAAAAAAVESARLQLSYCSVRAPIAGRTGNISVHEGDLIRSSEAGNLVTINQLNPIYVTFGVAQQYLPAIARYRAEHPLAVEIRLGSTEETPAASGELTFVDNAVDTTTGTIRLKATIANEQQRLWPGQFATVAVRLAAPEVLTVPASAVQSDQAGQHVFVVKTDSTAEFRKIVVERTFNDDAVVTAGLEAGDTVVTDGQLRVISGRPVQVKPADILTNPTAAGREGVAADKAGPGSGQGKQQKKKSSQGS